MQVMGFNVVRVECWKRCILESVCPPGCDHEPDSDEECAYQLAFVVACIYSEGHEGPCRYAFVYALSPSHQIQFSLSDLTPEQRWHIGYAIEIDKVRDIRPLILHPDHPIQHQIDDFLLTTGGTV